MRVLLIYFLITVQFSLAQNDQYEANQFMLAENYEQAGNHSKAIEIIEQLYQRNPDNQVYFDKLYNLYLITKKYETAIRIVEFRLTFYPDDPSLFGLLGSVYYLMGEIQLAKQKWEIPIKKNPQNPFVYKMMSNYAIERRAFEIAIEYLVAGKNKSNDPTIFSLELGELYLITMQYESAIKVYCEMLIVNQVMYSLVESKIFSFINKPEVIEKSIKIVGAYQDQGIVFKNLLAKLLTESRQFEKAFELYKEIEKLQSTGGQQLLNFANFLINENEFKIAKKVFEHTYLISSNINIKSSAKLGLARTLEALVWNNFNNQNDIWKTYFQPNYFNESRTKNVISAYEEVINLFRHSDVAVEALFSTAKIRLYINNEIQKAEEVFNQIINFYPTSRFYSKSLLELAIIKMITGKNDEAKEIFTNIEKVYLISEEDKLLSDFYLSKLLTAEGNFVAAAENLRKITNNVKNDFTNDALELSLLLNISKNDSLNLIKFAKAEILIIRKKFKEAQILFDEIALNQQSLVFQPFCLLKSAEMDIALNDYQSGITKLDQIYSEKEKNIFSDKALYLKAKIYEYAFNDLSSALETYQKILMEFPKSIYLDESRESIIRLKDENMKRKKDV